MPTPQTQDAESRFEMQNAELQELFKGTLIEGDPVKAYENGKIDLNQIRFPVILQNQLIFKTGTFNGLTYRKQELKATYMRAEGKPICHDHIEKTYAQIGIARNVKWVDDKEEVRGDLVFLSELPVRLICMGAKWGLSPTYSYMEGARPNTVYDPEYKEISIVFNPACRATMLNSLRVINNSLKMTGEKVNLELTEDALEKLLSDNNIPEELKTELRKKKKKPDETYQYPEAKMQAMSNEISELKKLIQNSIEKPKIDAEKAANEKAKEDLKTASEKVTSLEAKVKDLEGQLTSANASLKSYTDAEATIEVQNLITTEKEMGLLEVQNEATRKTEIEKMTTGERKTMQNSYKKINDAFTQEANKKKDPRKSKQSAGTPRKEAQNNEQSETMSVEEEMMEFCQKAQEQDGSLNGGDN